MMRCGMRVQLLSRPVASADEAITVAAREVLGRDGTGAAHFLRSRNVPFVGVTGYDEAALNPSLRGCSLHGQAVVFGDLLEKAAAALDTKTDT